MENLPRNLERYRVGGSRIRQLVDRLPRLTFLVVDDYGKVFSLRRVRSLIIGLFLLLICSLAANVVLSVLYWQSEDARIAGQKALDDATTRLDSLRAEKEVMLAQMVLTDPRAAVDHPVPREGEAPAAADGVGENRLSAGGSEDEPQDGEASPPGDGPPAAAAPKTEVLLEDVSFDVNPAHQALQARFKIKNNLPTDRHLEGYIFVIFKPETDHPNAWLVSPTVPIDAGLPSNINKGKYFKILNYKTLRFTAKTDSDPLAYTRATVMVFAEDHTPLLEQTFSVNG